MRYLLTAVLSSALAAQPPGPPQPLPPQPVPAQNPITPAKAILGKLLFWEEQLSSNNRVACGTCHTFGVGGGDARRLRHPGADGIAPSADDTFGSPGLRRSDAANDYVADPGFGFGEQVTGRASPSFLTAAWFTELFWDGRARTTFRDPDSGAVRIATGGALESQAVEPPLSGVEMAHDLRSYAQVTAKLAAARPMALATALPNDMAAAIAGGTSYPDLFADAFGTPEITAARIAMALATYQRTLVPDQTPYDAFVAGNQAALTPRQAMGLGVFQGPGRCAICHPTGLFADDQFHNLGLRPIAQDGGRQVVTGNPAHAGRFKTPSLRNVGLRNSFMHTGQFATLQQVVGFYIQGGGPNLQNKDPQLVPLNLPPQAASDLIDFLSNGLTDPRVAAGVAPFDRPTLRSELLPATGSQIGQPSLGTGNLPPQILPEVPANVGHGEWKVGVHDALGGAGAMFLLDTAPGLHTLHGVTFHLALSGNLIMVPGVLDGAAGVPAAGYGTLRVGIPNVAALAGVTFWGQWLIFDGGAPGGVAAATRAARIDVF